MEQFPGVSITEVVGNVVRGVRTETGEAVEIKGDVIVNALGSKKNEFDLRGLCVPYLFAGDCSGEKTADIASAIRSGYNSGNEILSYVL